MRAHTRIWHHKHVREHTRTHTHTHGHTCSYERDTMSVCLWGGVSLCLCLWHVCIYVHIHQFAYICMYVRICRHAYRRKTMQDSHNTHTCIRRCIHIYLNIDTCIHNHKQTCINSCVPKCLHPLSLALILCVYILSLTLPICAHSLSRSWSVSSSRAVSVTHTHTHTHSHSHTQEKHSARLRTNISKPAHYARRYKISQKFSKFSQFKWDRKSVV